jgi:peptide/nickel transport system ATP-binding protein
MTQLLEVRDLVTEIDTPKGPVRPVDGVTLSLARGEMLGIVGESGSGKTVLVRSIMGLLPDRASLRPPGRIHFDGRDITDLTPSDRRDLWGKRIALIPQDPATSLNPVRKVGVQIMDTLRRHGGLSRSDARKQAARLLGDVGIADPERRLDLYPHEMSGGMRQRVLIAIAIANSPDMLIADEPTTALDVTIQRQILDLIDTLRREHNIGVLLISHDLSVVAGRSDRVVVMYGGKLVESLRSHQLVEGGRHPYTRGLLESEPDIAAPPRVMLRTIPGEPPDIRSRHRQGCPFRPRCHNALDVCATVMPPLVSPPLPDQAAHDGAGHLVACHNPVEPRTVLTTTT